MASSWILLPSAYRLSSPSLSSQRWTTAQKGYRPNKEELVLPREGRRVHSLGRLHIEKQMNDGHWLRSAGELCERSWSFAGWVEQVGLRHLSNCATNYTHNQNTETAIRGRRFHRTHHPRHLRFAMIHTDVIRQTTSDLLP